jgi:hypothetical protein
LLNVHVAADTPGGHNAVNAGLCEREADNTTERMNGNTDTVSEPGPFTIQVPDVEPRIFELIGEKSKSWYERRPAETALSQV